MKELIKLDNLKNTDEQEHVLAEQKGHHSLLLTQNKQVKEVKLHRFDANKEATRSQSVVEEPRVIN